MYYYNHMDKNTVSSQIFDFSPTYFFLFFYIWYELLFFLGIKQILLISFLCIILWQLKH